MMSNHDRAARAANALTTYQAEILNTQAADGVSGEEIVTDLLVDLHHWCDQHEIDFATAVEMARLHHQAESPEGERVVKRLTDAFGVRCSPVRTGSTLHEYYVVCGTGSSEPSVLKEPERIFCSLWFEQKIRAVQMVLTGRIGLTPSQQDAVKAAKRLG